MIQSIKVDVIYFTIPTDFEMEFNLGGCCRMRLLADKANDGKDFIRSLSRAVSRSRVIICCGPLFGEAGLISRVATAIGRPLSKAENATFGIQGEQEIDIIDGSMPLVTKEGVFGGCVIESGPQSIILLTESKSVRKTLMGALIHPYIEGLSRKSTTPAATENKDETPAEESIAEETLPETEAVTEETAENTENTEEPATENAEDTAAVSVTPDVDIPAVVPSDVGADVSGPSVEENKQAPTETEETDESNESDETVVDEEVPAEPEETETVEEQTETAEPQETEENTEEPAEEEKPQDESDGEQTEEIEAEETDEAEEETNETETEEAEENSDETDDKAESADDDFFVPRQEKPQLELFIDPNDVVFNHKKYYEMYYEANENLVGANNGNYVEPEKKRLSLPILILLIVLVVGLLFLGYFLVARPLINGTSISENFSHLLSGEVPIYWLT